MGGGSTCRPHAHSSPAFSTSQGATGWRRDLAVKEFFAACRGPIVISIPSLLAGPVLDLQRAAHRVVSRAVGRAGGTKLIKLGLALLVTWLVGVLFFSNAGDAVHVLLLVGLALLLLGFLRARDEAMRHALGDNPGKK